ncbi:sensor histidine kinase [Rapidithrix thailandica]|uniref:histidine kinase n=1 Tax=Rapidithrix thailandica TaxID=413964 RepID=A0AAW9S5X0_9BACT
MKKLHSLSLKFKLTLVISLLIFLSFLGNSVFNFYSVRTNIRKKVFEKELPILVDNAFLAINEHLNQGVLLSEFVSRSRFIHDFMKSEVQDTAVICPFLRELARSYNIESLHIVPENKRWLYSNTRPARKVTPNTDIWYFNFKNKLGDKEFNIDTNKALSEMPLTFYVNHKVFDLNGTFLGMADVAMDLQDIVRLVTSQPVGKFGNTFMVDRNGFIKIHRNSSLMDTNNEQDPAKNINQQPGLSIIAPQILASEMGIYEYEKAGKKMWLMQRYISKYGWYMLVEISEDEVLAPYYTLLLQNLLWALLITLLIIAVSIIGVNKLVLHPLFALKQGLTDFFHFLSRQTDHVDPIPVINDDEFGKMAGIVNVNVAHIKEGIAQDSRLIAEMRALTAHIQQGTLSDCLQEEGYNPELVHLKEEINRVMKLLEQKIGKDLNEILRVLQEYERMDFSNPLLNPSGEIELQVTRMGHNIYENMDEIQAQNEELRQQQEEISLQKEYIQSQNQQLQKINQQMEHINNNLEKEVQERTVQLKVAYEELDTFLYRSSHDLRRPLTTLLGLVEVSKLTQDRNEYIELFKMINHTIMGMDGMLKKLIDVSENLEEQLPPVFIDFEKLVSEIQNQLLYPLTNYKIDFQLELSERISFCEREHLVHSILYNLIENAIVYRRETHPFVKVRVENHLQGVQIRVEDNGQGIAKTYQKKVFDMFFRANGRVGNGNGLGLYVVKKVIEKIEGAHISFQSQVDEGTVFEVYIPTDNEAC